MIDPPTDQSKPTPHSVLLAACICLITTPLLMILFCLAETSYQMWEYGVLVLVGLLFIVSLFACSFCLFFVVLESRMWHPILLVLIMAVGPFAGVVIGVTPNPHGLSTLLLALYALVAWAVDGCLLVIILWKILFRKRDIISIK